MYHTDPKPTFFNVKREPTAEDLMKAEDLWIKEAQRNMQENSKQENTNVYVLAYVKMEYMSWEVVPPGGWK